MNRAHAYRCEEADRIVEEAIRGVGADVDALRVPRLAGVVLGGGYARGEGGVVFGRMVPWSHGPMVPSTERPSDRTTIRPSDHSTIRPSDHSTIRPSDHQTVRLSNDLDFYVVAEEGTDAEGLARIAEALRPVSEKWTAALGVDVDFSPPKTPWRIRHDQERLMIQDLVNGYCDVAGKPGTELFAGVDRRPPEALPAMEAVRFLVNRGVGLLLAASAARSSQVREFASSQVPNSEPANLQTCEPANGDEAADFVARNINKVVLGCGDAKLIAAHRYRWKAEDRAAELGDALYARAVQWKFRPQPEPVCDWETARNVWMETVDLLCSQVPSLQVPSSRIPGSEPANLRTCEPANAREAGSVRSALRRRTPRAAARWLARRRSLGPAPLRTLGLDPLVRILEALHPLVRERKPFPPSLRRDWEIFN